MTCKPFKIALAVSFALFLVLAAPKANAMTVGTNGNSDVWIESINNYAPGNYIVAFCNGVYNNSFPASGPFPIDSFQLNECGYTGLITYSFNAPGNNTLEGYIDQISFYADSLGNISYPVSGSTRILNIIPDNGTTTASTTEIGATVYINSNDLSSTTAYDPQIQMTLTSPDNGTSRTFYFPSAAEPITTAGDQTFSATTTLQDGLYNITTALTVPPFGQFPGQTYDSTTTNFIVNQSAYLALQSSQYGIATTTCSVSNIAGCFQNALVYLFWPNASAIASYSTFQALIYQKPPVGYFSLVQNALNGVTSTSSTSSIPWSSGTLSYGGSVFSSLRLGIAGILWFFFLIEFWHRIRNIKI